MRKLSIRTLSATTALALVAAMASVAHASQPNVTVAIKAQDKVINQSPGSADLNHLKKLSTRAQAKKLVVDLTKLEKTAAHAITVVARSSTTSAQQQQGKADWLKGSREQDRGIRQLTVALKDVLAGNKTAAKAQSQKALKTLLAGTELGIKGDKLLGLPADD
jgi:hypothetical protein